MENSQHGETGISGGVDLQTTGNVNIGGDVIGRDKIISLPPALPAQPGFFYRSPHTEFVGRKTLLQQLHLTLNTDRDHHPRPLALVGMSGVGKTQLAIEYARRYGESYPGGIYWIDVAKGWEDQIVTRAEQVGLREYAVPEAESRRLLMLAFSNFLNTHPQALLILDGVNDFSELAWSDQTTGFRFAELRCRILITTHSDVVGLPFETIPVDVLSEAEAVEILLGTQVSHRSDHEMAAARTICGMLGYLPLAVSIAAAFLNFYREVSLSDYRDRLQREGGLKVIDQTLAELPLSIYEWAISVALKFQWSALKNVNAKFVLQIIALLGSHTWVTQAQLALLTNLPDEADSGHPVPLETALIPLRQLSLLEETSPARRGIGEPTQSSDLRADRPDVFSKSVHLHALVQEFVRQQMSAEGNEDHLKDQIEQNLSSALHAATASADRILVVGECLLLVPDWKPPRLRELIFEGLLELMNDVTAPTLKRHQAALLLANLHWLDETWIALFPDTMLNYMEFIARYVDLSAEHQYLEQRLSKLLDDRKRIKLNDRERAELLVFRAVMRAQLGRSDKAEADYKEAWRLAGETSNRLAARIKLGLANILRNSYETMAESSDLDAHQEAEAGLQSVVSLYREALEFARRYGEDVNLQVSILKELAYTYALFDQWEPATQCCLDAMKLVPQIEDDGYRLIRLAQVQETESFVHFKRGLRLRQSNSPDALAAFGCAYDIVEAEIAQLDQFSIKNFDYVLAHNNAGEYLLEESRCPNCQVPRLLAARNHLLRALELARRLKITLLEKDAEDFLAEVAARQQEIDQGKE